MHVDCIGNWRFEVSKSVVLNLCALTMIDPITNLLEIVCLPQVAPNAEMVMQAFENTWLSRYPKPMTIISDHGAEFIGHEFPQKLLEAGIQFKLVSLHNPQSNGIIKQVHRTISQILQVMIEQQRPRMQAECEVTVDDGLATAMHAT